MSWPRITLVTPSLDQGEYLETAIRSVLDQNYPNLEYFVLDGGSRDCSRKILERYRDRIDRVVCGRDGGQASALNRGLRWATGEIFHWLNADDCLVPGALFRVARAMEGADAVAGAWIDFDESGDSPPRRSARLVPKALVRGGPGTVFHQPALWLRRKGVLACGGLRERWDYAFDWDLAIRYLHRFPRVRYVDSPLVRFRHHPRSKTATVGSRFPRERREILSALLADDSLASLHDACRNRLARERWWRELAELMGDGPASRWDQAWAIVKAASREPRARVSRMTLGALRRTLAGTGAPREKA